MGGLQLDAGGPGGAGRDEHHVSRRPARDGASSPPPTSVSKVPRLLSDRGPECVIQSRCTFKIIVIGDVARPSPFVY